VKTIITTSGRPDEAIVKRAEEAANVLGYNIVERKKRSIKMLQDLYNASIVVAGASRYELYNKGMTEPFFFHPNSAAFRLKRIVKGEVDPLVDAAQLQVGQSFLDCTLGLASDSITASFVTGKTGEVCGIEVNPSIAFIVSSGLKTFPSPSQDLIEAMQRIKTVQMDALAFLKNEPDASWDIVYMDPMFNLPITESSNFTPLRQVGHHDRLTQEWVNEALRVCRRRVVIKARFDSPIFEMFNFNRVVRPNTKFHFGFISK